MKKYLKEFALFFVLIFILCASGCGNAGQTQQSNDNTEATVASTSQQADADTETTTAAPSQSSSESTAKSTEASSSVSSSANSSDEDNNIAGTFPIVNEKISLKFFAPQKPTVKDINTNEWTIYYEDKTNVHVDWELVPVTALAEKRGLLLASGDLPDVFFGAGVTREEEMIYGPMGLFLPLNNLIEQYGVEIKRMFSEVSYIEAGITTPDGNIYSLPQVNECFHCMYPQKMYINKSWLDNLNLEMPQTTEEFYNIMKAFKENDPNGNGLQDEIPLSGFPQDGSYDSIEGFLMNSFIYFDRNEFLVLKDDIIDMNINKEQFRDGLRYLNQMYREGLIDPNAFIQNGDSLKQLVEQETQIIGSVAAYWFGDFANSAGVNHKSYEVIPPLIGPEGVKGVVYKPYSYSTGTFVITVNCKYPDVAIQYADYLYSPEATIWYIEYGIENQDWRVAEPGEIDLNGNQAKWVRLNWAGYGDDIQNVHYDQTGPSYRSRDFRESWGQIYDRYDTNGISLRNHQDTINNYLGNEPSQVFPPLYLSPEKIEQIAQTKTPLVNYIKEHIAKFIVGDLDLDADWDNYLNDLERMNITEYISIYQDEYNNSAYKK